MFYCTYRNVKLEDEGMFVCRATNEGGYNEEVVWLIVHSLYIICCRTIIINFTQYIVRTACSGTVNTINCKIYILHIEILQYIKYLKCIHI